MVGLGRREPPAFTEGEGPERGERRMAASVESILSAGEAEVLAGLVEFVRWPSVSNNPDQAAKVRGCAEWLAEQLRATGLDNVALWETAGHPVVHAEWRHADRPALWPLRRAAARAARPLALAALRGDGA